MEELIFFAVIIFFSIIESIARSRKKQQGGRPQIPEEWEVEEPTPGWRPQRPVETTTATYDADASYDEIELDEAPDSRETLPEYSRPQGTSEGRGVPARSGSERMVPADIWEEIAGLARGRMRQLETEPETPAPLPAPKIPPATASGRAAWGKRTPRVGQQHRVHMSHAGYGTDPSSRAQSAHDGMDPLARKLSADVRAVRQQLRRGRHALRQAVILQEVLGPPASMRPEAFLE